MPVISINEVVLNYREVGDPSKRTLVFLPSVLWGAEAFAPLIAALAPDFHIIDIDLHGHGGSGYRTPLTVAEMATDYAQLLKRLGLSQVAWIGCSLGGIIGLQLALDQPGLIPSLVLIASTMRNTPSPIGAQTRQLWELFRAGHREDIVDPALQLFFARATYQQQPQLVQAYRQRAVSFQAVEGMYQAALAALEPNNLADQLAELRAKTLLIVGREDVTATPADAQAMATLIPDAQLAIVEETSHLLAVEKPQEVARLVRQFL